MGDVPWRLLYAGLAFGAITQVFVIVMYFTGELRTSMIPAGNFSALVVCLGAAWFIRQRQKGRL